MRIVIALPYAEFAIISFVLIGFAVAIAAVINCVHLVYMHLHRNYVSQTKIDRDELNSMVHINSSTLFYN